jgi:hypothetical protein
MGNTMRPAAVILLLITIAGALFEGCATQERQERAAMLSLSCGDFDQTYGSGFRVLYDRGQYFEGAVLIGDYLKAHRELTIGQQKFLHFHAAQLYALAGKNTLAVQQLDHAVWRVQTPGLHGPQGVSLNDMAATTKAFLTQDRAALLAAGASNLVENLGSSYADVLLWHRICPSIGIPQDASKAHRAAAEKLAKAFGFPLTEMQTNAPTRCVWLELRSFHPFEYSGYVIIHSRDGTVVTASDQGWLDAAVERFIKSSRMRNGYREARYGLVTSFDVPK